MANLAYYELHVHGTRKDIERFQRIMSGSDDTYTIYVFDHSREYNNIIHCEGDSYRMDFFGEVKWSSNYLSEQSDVKFDSKTRMEVITWLDASRLFHLTMEWYCEECGSMICEYHSIKDGINLRSDLVYWSYPGTFDQKNHQSNIDCFEGEVNDALDNGIQLDMSQVEEIRGDDYALLEELDRFSFGGYTWVWHSQEDIGWKVAPVMCTDIRRL